MKRILAFIILLAISWSCLQITKEIILQPIQQNSSKIEVDSILTKPFLELVEIYKEYDINIDYSQITYIETMRTYDKDFRREGDSSKYEGLYSILSGHLFIETDQTRAFLDGTYEDTLICILAHEIAHSQGFPHSSDPTSLMYPNSSFTSVLLQYHSVEQLVTDIYTCPYNILYEAPVLPIPIPE